MRHTMIQEKVPEMTTGSKAKKVSVLLIVLIIHNEYGKMATKQQQIR